MFKSLSNLQHLRLVFCGIAMGIANLIPGVSGGTIAVILSIYDDLITALNGFFTDAEHRRRHVLFLFQIGFGAIASILLCAKLFDYLLKSFPQPTTFFFIGLIIGSIPFVYRAHNNMSPTLLKVSMFAISFVAIVIISLCFPSSTNHTLSTLTLSTTLLLGLSGVIAAAAMIIPGLSGSFILLLMGTYGTIIEAISERQVTIIAIVGVGAILGVLLMAKVMHFFLQRYPAYTYYGILGLMIGSLVKLWPGMSLDISGVISLICAISGGYLATRLG